MVDSLVGRLCPLKWASIMEVSRGGDLRNAMIRQLLEKVDEGSVHVLPA